MKKGYALLAAASLLLGTSFGRSEDSVPLPMPVAPVDSTGASDAPKSASPARSLTLRQRLAEWAKLRPVSQEVAVPAEPAAPVPPAVIMPPPQTPPTVPPLYAPGSPCLSGSGHRSCGEQLHDWLTYRRLDQDCCYCFPKCAPCCPPPLYVFFIGTCCVHPTGPGCGAPCGYGGGGASNSRRRQILENLLFNHDKCCSQGDGNPHLRQFLDNFFFKQEQSCAHGACAAGESIAEKPH